MAYIEAFAAVADPTRQRLLGCLQRRPYAVGELARALRISQPAVSQHLARLRRAKLVRSRADRQRRIYALDPLGIAVLRAHLDRMWNDALTAYAKSFEE